MCFAVGVEMAQACDDLWFQGEFGPESHVSL